MHLSELEAFFDRYLKIHKVPDNSINGLQIKCSGEISSVAFAVDACLDVFLKAKRSRAQLVVVHHGLFWDDCKRRDTITKKRVMFLKENRISLYAAHLPLDIHPVAGNNAVIAGLLGLKKIRPFGEYNGVICGLSGVLARSLPRESFARIAEEKIGPVSVRHFFGRKNVHRIGIVSGGGAFAVRQMRSEGIDTLLSGEPKHSEYHFSMEAKVNALYAGHYLTERFGVMALAEILKKKFPEIETRFIDSPTGL